jgi:glycosyltransferase involved in cell wall biosynthesis
MHIRAMSEPRISIVMAAKDEGLYIQNCIESTIQQTFEEWELIVVDDHSTDNTAEIIKDFAHRDTRVRYFKSEGNRLNGALLTAQKHIKAPLINRMDADDLMPDYKLNLMYHHWLKYGQRHVVAGGTQHFVDDGEVGDGFLRYDAWLNEVARLNRHWVEIYRECVIPSHCWLIHRDDFFKIGGFADCYPEDYDLCFRFYKAGLKVIGLNKVLHYWRDTETRISKTWDEYKDNRYFELKLKYFFEIDFDPKRGIAVWGAGKNGKDLVTQLLKRTHNILWYTNNERKVGKDIYGIRLRNSVEIDKNESAQILIAISNPKEREEVKVELHRLELIEGTDFWFFL